MSLSSFLPKGALGFPTLGLSPILLLPPIVLPSHGAGERVRGYSLRLAYVGGMGQVGGGAACSSDTVTRVQSWTKLLITA